MLHSRFWECLDWLSGKPVMAESVSDSYVEMIRRALVRDERDNYLKKLTQKLTGTYGFPSDRLLAEILDVSLSSVNKVIREMELANSSFPSERVSRSGRLINTAKIGELKKLQKGQHELKLLLTAFGSVEVVRRILEQAQHEEVEEIAALVEQKKYLE